MALYPYVAALAFDPATKTVAANATGQVYAKADTTYSAALTTVDASGQPIELTTNEDGILPSFYVEDHAGVNWKSGSWVFPLVTSEPLPGPQGDRGTSIVGVTVAGDAAEFELSDGTTTAPVTLPTAAGGSNAGVAEYMRVDGPTKTELDTKIGGAVTPYSHTDSSGLVTHMIAQANPAVNVLDAPALSISGPGGANPIGTGVDYPYDLSSGVTAIGCYPVSIVALSTNYTQNQVNGQSGAGAKPWAIEFDTASQNVSMIFRAAGSSVRFHVFVDGRPATRNPQTFTNNISSNSKSYLKLTFGSAKLRRVRIYMNAADYGGLRVDTGTTAAPTTLAEKISVAMYGDSWFAGTTLAGWPYTPGTVLGRILGWEAFECSIGGTGYVASATPFNVAARTTPLYAVTPDYVIVSGSINDNSSTGVQDAAAAFYAGIGTNLPSAKIIVVGPQPVPANYATSTALLANRDAVKAAALAASNVIGFIDPIESKWLSGTGNIANPAGDGNRDAFIQSDALHPTKQGSYYYATRIAEEVVRVLDKNGLNW